MFFSGFVPAILFENYEKERKEFQMENEQQPNVEKSNDEVARKVNENDSIILPEATSDQSLQGLTSLVCFFFSLYKRGIIARNNTAFKDMNYYDFRSVLMHHMIY